MDPTPSRPSGPPPPLNQWAIDRSTRESATVGAGLRHSSKTTRRLSRGHVVSHPKHSTHRARIGPGFSLPYVSGDVQFQSIELLCPALAVSGIGGVDAGPPGTVMDAADLVTMAGANDGFSLFRAFSTAAWAHNGGCGMSGRERRRRSWAGRSCWSWPSGARACERCRPSRTRSSHGGRSRDGRRRVSCLSSSSTTARRDRARGRRGALERHSESVRRSDRRPRA